MKKIYISHPLVGDGSISPRVNLSAIGNIARLIAFKEPDALVLSPVHAFAFLPCGDTRCDARAREMCAALVALADEVRVFGRWETSEGCKMEIEKARELCVPIFYESGEAEWPKRYYCVARLGLLEFDDDLDFATIPAASLDDAKVKLGCSSMCEVMCECGGPAVYEESDEEERG